jgi:pimeloyl-ACP methyl ester carboxylesterase
VPTAAVNGLTIDYEVHGAPAAPPLLAIMGLSMPAAAWPPALIELLVERGARVITFDNRDAGGSTRFGGARTIPVAVAIARAALRLPVPAPYTLHDMAADAVGLLDALGIEQAHVIGVSMGGMIGQLAGGEHPRRVASLTSIMSSTGNPSRGSPLAAARHPRHPARPKDPRDLQSLIDNLERKFSVIGTPAAAGARRPARPLRAHRPPRPRHGCLAPATARRAGHRRPPRVAGKRITAPTLVLHGRLDPLLPVAAGIETARCIPGARLVVIDDMGHDLPPPLLPRIAEEIASIASLPGGRASGLSSGG